MDCMYGDNSKGNPGIFGYPVGPGYPYPDWMKLERLREV